jgi:acyl-CoA thioesterase FadM
MGKASFSNTFKLRVSDFDFKDNILLSSVLDFAQDVAGNHADTLGIGYSDFIKDDKIWMVIRHEIEYVEYPPLYEEIKVITWPLAAGKIDCDRETLIVSSKDENRVYIKMSSKWIVASYSTRRIQRLVDLYKGCEEDVPLVSIDGKELFVGMMVYAEVMQKWTGEPAKCNLNFVFASYGKIVRMHYHRTRWSRIGKVYVEHEFLCIGEDGHAFGDARRKGNVLEYSVNQILVDIPDDFAEQYVREVVNDKMSYDVLEPTCHNFYYEVSEWLKHIGVYDQVMELYADEKSRGTAPGFARMAEQRRRLQEELDNKLRNILSRLSDTEKKRMKELLSMDDNK